MIRPGLWVIDLGKRWWQSVKDSGFPFVHVQSGSSGPRVHLDPVLVARGLNCGRSMGGSQERDKDREDQQTIHWIWKQNPEDAEQC